MHNSIYPAIAMPTFANAERTAGGRVTAPGTGAAPITDTERLAAKIAELEARNAELEAAAKKAETGLHNIDETIAGNILTLRIDLSKIEPTAGTVGNTGQVLKTDRIATSRGNHAIEIPGGRQGYYSLNVGAYPANRPTGRK